MPIYEYLCAGCSDTFEELVSMNDESSVRCPSCGEATVTRLKMNDALRLFARKLQLRVGLIG